MENNRLLCTGDPILDLYIDKDNQMQHFNGGALNIYQNILALLSDCKQSPSLTSNISFAYPNDGYCALGDIFSYYTILRTPLDTEGLPLVSESNKTSFYTPDGIAELIQEFKPTILILGDYNKGVLNSYYDKELPDIKYGIVDSRYKSLDLRWLEPCQKRFWHATGDEFDEEWGKNFDYIFWTDGQKAIKILKQNKLLSILKVPDTTKVVDTCGAGDTFTAAIAACLHAYDDTSDDALISYAKFAIEACQDVISTPHTSTTRIRIKEKCLSLT